MIEDMTLKEIKENGLASEISDGYHTFSELYEQRASLLALLCNEMFLKHNDLCYKTKRHSDGDSYPMPKGYFLVSLETLYGPVTYHVEDRFWDLFQIAEKEEANKFDGANAKECLKRIQQTCESYI